MGQKPYSDEEYQRYFSRRARRDLMEKRYLSEKRRRVMEVNERAQLEATTSRLSFLIVVQVLMLMVILGEGYSTHWAYSFPPESSALMPVLFLCSMLGTPIVFPWILLELLRFGVVSQRVKDAAVRTSGPATATHEPHKRKVWVRYVVAIVTVAIAVAFGYLFLAST